MGVCAACVCCVLVWGCVCCCCVCVLRVGGGVSMCVRVCAVCLLACVWMCDLTVVGVMGDGRVVHVGDRCTTFCGTSFWAPAVWWLGALSLRINPSSTFLLRHVCVFCGVYRPGDHAPCSHQCTFRTSRTSRRTATSKTSPAASVWKRPPSSTRLVCVSLRRVGLHAVVFRCLDCASVFLRGSA